MTAIAAGLGVWCLAQVQRTWTALALTATATEASLHFDGDQGSRSQRLDSDQEPPYTVRHPNIASPRQNAYRRRLLIELRGFGGGDGMFIGFPLRVEGHRAALPPKELLEVRYIDDRACDDPLGHAFGRQAAPS